MNRYAAAAIALSLAFGGAAFARDPKPEQPESASPELQSPRAAATAKSYMVAAAHPMAAQAARDVLAKGGTAADALVAAQFMLNLVEPQSSGVGGGAFLLYWDAKAKRLLSYDGRETAPAAATPDYWLDKDGKPMGWWQAVIGGRSVGVPGVLALLEAAHKAHGRKPWAELLAPARKAAEEGFEITPRLGGAIAEAAETGLKAFPQTAAYFLNEDGAPRKAGEILKNPDFAATLDLIAKDGAAAMYGGPLGEAIVAAVTGAENPGVMTAADLAGYEAKLRPPVCAAYRGAQICGMGEPSSGGLTVGQIMGVLEHFDMPSMAPDGPRAAEGRRVMLEAMKLAYADRGQYIADSDFTRTPGAGLLDPAYLTLRAQSIDPDKAGPVARPGNPPWRQPMRYAPDTDPEKPGTTHIVIVDAKGDVASMTSSIETGFGSRLMVGGFLLNNELTDFSREPSKDGRPIANRVEGGKRPRSSMAPTIVLADGAPILAVGSPGGSRIIGFVAESLVAMLDWGMDPQTAVGLPHVLERNSGKAEIEAGPKAEALEAELKAAGYETAILDLNSGLHAVRIAPGALTGGADPRREGLALGE